MHSKESSCLNQFLYDALSHVCGTVEVVHRNEPHKLSYRTHPVTGVITKHRTQGETSEEYRCNCPFHPDSGRHLYVNHMFGVRDAITGDYNLDLAHCHHDCLRDYSTRKDLYRMLYHGVGARHAHIPANLVRKPREEEYRKPVDVHIPGDTIPISQLPETHPARRYLCEDRKFRLEVLDAHNVGYCRSVDCEQYKRASQRIIIPYYYKHQLVGWQARMVGEPRHKGVPKYLTCPGMKKSQYIYNYDKASQYTTVVITEGIMDAWRCGPFAVSLLGKTASDMQLRLIAEQWPTVVVLLDIDAKNDSTRLCERLVNMGVRNVHQMFPSEGFKDVGAMPQEMVDQLFSITI